MADFAKLNEADIVVSIIHVDDDVVMENGIVNEAKGIAFLVDLYGHQNWVLTDQTGIYRKNYAGIGFVFDRGRDAFIPPKPFPSWVLNEQRCQWDSPIPWPLDSHEHYWDENIKNWV